MNKDEYDNTLKYLFGLEKFGMVFGLDNIRWLMDVIGNPHNAIKTVHIAGTNGKGSTATMLASILTEGGFRTGKYTSPHVISFTERITVDDVEITEEETVELTAYLRNKIEAADKNRFFTFFDFTTALACEYFRRKGVDIAVMETGLGGRLDSTNILKPLVSIITNVDYDHMEQLGSTIEEIAAEKAGIIKEGVPLVTGCSGAAGDVVEAKARSLHSKVYILGRDFSFQKEGDNRLLYEGIDGKSRPVYVNLIGDHQLTNCAVALCASQVLAPYGFAVGKEASDRALAKVTISGRLEKVKEDPLVILDAAHNPQGIQVLADFMKDHFQDKKKKILIFGVMKDKEYTKMLEELAPLMDTVILTKPKIERALAPEGVQLPLKDAMITHNTTDALKRAKELAQKEDMILVTGSFYTIGEVKAAIDEIF